MALESGNTDMHTFIIIQYYLPGEDLYCLI